MKELLVVIAKSLVDYPEEVEVTESQSSHSLTLSLKVHPDDMGKVIGKQGRVARAIRTVLRSANPQPEKKVIVEIV